METHNNDIDKFVGKLKEILDYELSLGNKICETYRGDWPRPNIVAIFLEKPFSKPIYKNLDSIRFTNVNDPHYWKAEYYDSENNLLLACGFGGHFDVSEL